MIGVIVLVTARVPTGAAGAFRVFHDIGAGSQIRKAIRSTRGCVTLANDRAVRVIRPQNHVPVVGRGRRLEIDVASDLGIRRIEHGAVTTDWNARAHTLGSDAGAPDVVPQFYIRFAVGGLRVDATWTTNLPLAGRKFAL